MATRAIITHQPDVSCDMCGRRLLRGERPDVFLAAGSRRTVCELCVPRAAGEGWTRASETHRDAGPDRGRSGRGRSLLGRLRQRRESDDEGYERGEDAADWQPAATESWQQAPDGGWTRRRARRRGAQAAHGEADEAGSWLSDDEPQHDEQIDAGAASLEGEEWVDSGFAIDRSPMDFEQLDQQEPALPAQERSLSVDLTLEQAIEIFNASECAGRVAGIARALGQPVVTLSPHPHDHDRTTIVVAWELCWYRYEVDLRERPATIALLSEGTELDELPQEDKLGNASADERGELTLLR